MSAKRTVSSLRVAAALCAVGATALAANTGGASLGQTLTGETCRANEGKIYCGTEESGTLRVSTLPSTLPSDPTAHRAAVIAGARALPEGLATARDVTCDPGQWIGNGSETVLFLCTLRASNWPRVILVSASGSTLVAAEGLPSMLPVLEAAIQATLGRPAALGELEAAEGLVKAKYPAALTVGSNDFAAYKAQVESARL